MDQYFLTGRPNSAPNKELALFLVEYGTHSISVRPDSFVVFKEQMATSEHGESFA